MDKRYESKIPEGGPQDSDYEPVWGLVLRSPLHCGWLSYFG